MELKCISCNINLVKKDEILMSIACEYEGKKINMCTKCYDFFIQLRNQPERSKREDLVNCDKCDAIKEKVYSRIMPCDCCSIEDYLDKAKMRCSEHQG